MQLLLVLALILLGGRGDTRELIKEVKPVLESLGGEQMKSVVEDAERISEVISAVQTFAAISKAVQPDTGSGANVRQESQTEVKNCDISQSSVSPLLPVACIANGEITASLEKYFAAE